MTKIKKIKTMMMKKNHMKNDLKIKNIYLHLQTIFFNIEILFSINDLNIIKYVFSLFKLLLNNLLRIKIFFRNYIIECKILFKFLLNNIITNSFKGIINCF
jgi:hypothetical protein